MADPSARESTLCSLLSARTLPWIFSTISIMSTSIIQIDSNAKTTETTRRDTVPASRARARDYRSKQTIVPLPWIRRRAIKERFKASLKLASTRTCAQDSDVTMKTVFLNEKRVRKKCSEALIIQQRSAPRWRRNPATLSRQNSQGQSKAAPRHEQYTFGRLTM